MNDVFDDVFSGGKDFVVDGLEWIQRYDLVGVNPQESEKILEEMKSAFAFGVDAKKLAKINLFWMINDLAETTFVGFAPARLFNPHNSNANSKIMVVMVNRDQGKINIIDPSTGEIRQNIPK